jgi:hypothetical protein
VNSSGVVVVVGPQLSGVGGVVEVLRGQLPDHAVVGVVGPDELDPHCQPTAVVGVVSAVAPMTESDWAVIERVAARTDLVVGAVSKIDAHRGWRDVLAVNRALAAGWVPRHRLMRWVGVAAAPDLGEPRFGDLVAVLRERLADPGLRRRNPLGCNECRPIAGRPRSSRADAVELRSVLQRARLLLIRSVRDRSMTMRAELRDAASSVPPGGMDRFQSRVRDEVDRFLVDLDDEITRVVDAAAAELAVAEPPPVDAPDPPDVTGAPSSSRRLESRLMAVLGAGLGVGVAVAASRLVAGLAPGLSVAGFAAGAAVGLALVVWVVRVRGLLHDRALLDRWVTEVAATLKWHGEARIAERLLTAEVLFATGRATHSPELPI